MRERVPGGPPSGASSRGRAGQGRAEQGRAGQGEQGTLGAGGRARHAAGGAPTGGDRVGLPSPAVTWQRRVRPRARSSAADSG